MSEAARTNPYETPVSTLHQLDRMLERRLVVKLYLILAVVSVAARAALAGQSPVRAIDLAGVLALGLSLPALLGYAYRRPIGRAWMWKLWLPVSVLGAATLPLGFPIVLAPRFALAGRGYVYVFDALLCASVYLYAFRSPELWRSRSR